MLFFITGVQSRILKRKDSGGRSLCDQQAESVASLLARRRKEEGKKRIEGKLVSIYTNCQFIV